MSEAKIKTYPNIAQSFGVAGIVILGLLLIQVPLRLILKEAINKEAAFLIPYLLGIGIPFLIVYSIRKVKTGISSFNFTIRNPRIIPFIIIGSIVLLFGVALPLSNLIPMPEFVLKSMKALASQKGVLNFILMVIAAPVLEELIFRGIILDGLLKKYNPLTSIVISSLLFGLIHLNPWQFITGFIIGAFSGWVYFRTRSILSSIIIHASANLSAFAFKYFIDMKPTMNNNTTFLERYGGVTNFILFTTGAVIIVMICIYCLRRQFRKNGHTQLKTVTVKQKI